MDAATIKTYTGLVGALCSHWANFEFILVSVIWRFLGLDSDTGKIVTSGLDIESRAVMAVRLAAHLGVDLSWSHIVGQFGSEVKVYSGA